MTAKSISINSEISASSHSATKDSLLAPLRGMMVLTVCAREKTEREIRNLKLKATLSFFQHKIKNLITRISLFTRNHGTP